MRALTKFQMSYRFDPSQHPREDNGRFTQGGGSGGSPSFRQRALGESSPGPSKARSLTRGEAWQRTGSKLDGIPASYTGSAKRERPVDGFERQTLTEQIPQRKGTSKAQSIQAHQALFARLKTIVKGERAGAIEKALITREWVAVNGIKDHYQEKRRTGDYILPADAPRSSVNKAYNNAALLALHDVGVINYGKDFKMSDALKAELTPLVPFMRYVRRRLGQEINRQESGAGRVYKDQFGEPFPNPKYDKATGKERVRFYPHMELVKADWTESLHPRSMGGQFATAGNNAMSRRAFGRFLAGGAVSAMSRPQKKNPGVLRSVLNTAKFVYQQRAEPENIVHAAWRGVLRSAIRSTTQSKQASPLTALAGRAALRLIKADWDESRHPRGAAGKFAAGRGAMNRRGIGRIAPGVPEHSPGGALGSGVTRPKGQPEFGRLEDDHGKSARSFFDSLLAMAPKRPSPEDQKAARAAIRARIEAEQAANLAAWIGKSTSKLIKRDIAGALDPRVSMMMPTAHKTMARHTGGARSGLDPHVAKVMPHAHRLIRHHKPPTPPPDPAKNRAARMTALADHRTPLAHILRT